MRERSNQRFDDAVAFDLDAGGFAEKASEQPSVTDGSHEHAIDPNGIRPRPTP